MSPPTLWLIGDHDHADFKAAVEWLTTMTNCRAFATPREAAEAGRQDVPSPAAIVLAVARPGRFAAAEIEILHRCEPLTPLVALVGSLCEGEIRSGSPWPGVTRIYFHQWQARLPRALGIGAPDSHENWSPRTASAVDASEQLALTDVRQCDSLIAIRTTNIATFETLADACAAAGYRSVWLPPHLPPGESGADLLLTDEAREVSSDPAMQSIPRVVLANFPRREDIARAIASGAAAVVAKPFQLPDLWSALEIALQSRADRAAAHDAV